MVSERAWWLGGVRVRVRVAPTRGWVGVQGFDERYWWADRGHDGHGDVEKRVVVRGCEAVVVVGGRRVAAASTRPQLMGCDE